MAFRDVFLLVLVSCGVTIATGYLWGRVNSRRALDRAWDEGYRTGLDARDGDFYEFTVSYEDDDDPPEDGDDPPGDDETMVLVPRESPYEGRLTPAQRRRDKHKQRGQYAIAPAREGDQGGVSGASPVPYPALAPEVLGQEVMHDESAARQDRTAIQLENVPRPGSAGDRPPEGREPSGPGYPAVSWAERQRYVDAIEIARIEAAEATAMEDFHADVLAQDRYLAVWAEEARASLVPSWTRFGQMVSA